MATKAQPKRAAPVRGTRTATTKAKVVSAPMGADNWQAKEDLHHLRRAAEIQADPKRHKAAKSEGMQQMKALEKVMKK